MNDIRSDVEFTAGEEIIWAVGSNYQGNMANHFHVEDPQVDMVDFMAAEVAPQDLYLTN